MGKRYHWSQNEGQVGSETAVAALCPPAEYSQRWEFCTAEN